MATSAAPATHVPAAVRAAAADRRARIALLAPHWLGDTFWALQLVPFLRAAHPAGRLSAIVRPSNRWLAELWLPSEAVLTPRSLLSDWRREGLARLRSLAADHRRLHRQLGAVDLLIDLSATLPGALLGRGVTARVRYGALGRSLWRFAYDGHRALAAFGGHLAELPWWLLAPLYASHPAWPPAAVQRLPQLPPRATSELAGGPGAPGETLCFPGAGWEAKRWPLERFAALAVALAAAGEQPALLCAPEERALAAAAKQAVAHARRKQRMTESIAVAVTSGPELLARIRAARAVVTNDNGAAHLAAAAGRPTVVLFGPTHPLVCGPLGPRVHVLRADCAHRPEGARHCCGDRPGARCGEPCLASVSVGAVRAALAEALRAPA